MLTMASAPGPALADWRQEMGTFRIGIAKREGERLDPERFEQFREAVSVALSMPVEIFQANSATALIDAQASSRIEYSILTALGYATAYTLCECVEPLVAPVSATGAIGIRSVLLADPARVGEIADLAEIRIALGPENALGGDILPAAEFTWQGKPLAASGLDVVRAESAEDALRMFAEGEVSAVFTWRYVSRSGNTPGDFGPYSRFPGLGKDRYDVLWQSGPVRFGPHAVRRNLPAEARVALRRLLLSLEEEAPLVFDAVSPALGGGFEAVTHADYRTALNAVTSISNAER
jgi:phosphonate transport system substrate-binding protein